MQKHVLLAIVVLVTVSFTVADIPVHCEIQQIVGKWTFGLGDAGKQICNIFTIFPRS